MELRIERDPSIDGVTLGRLSLDGRFLCFTLEDELRSGPKIMHLTAIPAGRYRVRITKSARFGRLLPEVLNVPGFSGIRIHPGNTAADTSGCILVGLAVRGVKELLSSRAAMELLQPIIARAQAYGEDVWLTLVNLSDVPERKVVA